MSTFKQKIEAQRRAIAERSVSFERPYKFKVGKTHIRILPGVKDSTEISRQYGAHYIKDPRTGDLAAVVGDAEITYGKECPVRIAIKQCVQQANSRGDDKAAKVAKEWLARPVHVVNIQVVGGVDEENKGKVVRAEFSEKGWDSILSVLEEVDAQVDDFNIANGVIITVERTGTGPTDTRYTYTPHLKQPSSPPSNDVLNQRVDLDTYVDAKFGASVDKALVHLSNVLGKDVSRGALAAHNAAAAIAYDDDIISSSDTAAPATPAKTEAIDATFDDILLEEKPAPATKKAEPAAKDMDDILADLDNL